MSRTVVGTTELMVRPEPQSSRYRLKRRLSSRWPSVGRVSPPRFQSIDIYYWASYSRWVNPRLRASADTQSAIILKPESRTAS